MKNNVKPKRLDELIDSVVDEITLAKKVNYKQAEKAVNQLIDLTGNAALALGLEDKEIKLNSEMYEFTFTTKFIGE